VNTQKLLPNAVGFDAESKPRFIPNSESYKYYSQQPGTT